MNGFVCETCKGSLVCEHERLVCRRCSRQWPLAGGIPVFGRTSGYWGELDRDAMKEFNDRAEQTGWRTAAGGLAEKLQETISNEGRADWRQVRNAGRWGRVLDIGAGLGALSFSLAATSDRVYALEPVWERARFIDIRKRQDGVANLTPVCADALTLDFFADTFFDLVVLNGVLEWIGYLNNEMSPAEAQLHTLRVIRRVLKDEGTLYIAIENRFAYQYFLGAKDPHTGLRFINVMPYACARRYHAWKKKTPYRVLLRSYAGHRRMLGAAGFTHTEFYAPLPSYRNFRCLFPLNNPAACRYWMDAILFPKIISQGLLLRVVAFLSAVFLHPAMAWFCRSFVLDYSIFASRMRSCEHELKRAIVERHGGACNRVSLLLVKGFRKNLLFSFLDGARYPRYLWKVAHDARGKERLANEVRTLTHCASLGEDLSCTVPAVLESRTIGEDYCVLTDVSRKRSAVTYLCRHRNSEPGIADLFTAVRIWMTKLHTRTCGVYPDAQDRLRTMADEAFRHGILPAETMRARVAGLINAQIARAAGDFPFVLQHRDFSPDNVVYGERERGLCVFDWEYARTPGLPLVDLLNFFAHSAVCLRARQKLPLRSLVRMTHHFVPLSSKVTGDLVVEMLYRSNRFSALVAAQIAEYRKDMRLNDDAARLCLSFFMVEHCSHDASCIALLQEQRKPIWE